MKPPPTTAADLAPVEAIHCLTARVSGIVFICGAIWQWSGSKSTLNTQQRQGS